MRRPRFTIANILAFILFVAVSFAALREASDIWDSGVFGGTLALLLVSMLLAVHRTAARRAYWLGFALFGWTYLVMSLVPPIEARLPTTKALAYLDSKVSGRMTGWTFVVSTHGVGGNTGKPGQGAAFAYSGTTPANNQLTNVRLWDAMTGRLLAGPNGTTENFLRIGHSLLAPVLAFLGAHLSRYLHASGRPGHAQEPDVLSPPHSRVDDV